MILLLIAIFVFDIQFVLETISVGSGFIIFIWLLTFAIELPIICGLIAVAIIFANKIHKYNKEMKQTEKNL